MGTGTCNNTPTCENQLVIEQSRCPYVTGTNFTPMPAGLPVTFHLEAKFLHQVNSQNTFIQLRHDSEKIFKAFQRIIVITFFSKLLRCKFLNTEFYYFSIFHSFTQAEATVLSKKIKSKT